jgi:hypothetical protein
LAASSSTPLDLQALVHHQAKLDDFSITIYMELAMYYPDLAKGKRK